jgi:hypothetical protein
MASTRTLAPIGRSYLKPVLEKVATLKQKDLVQLGAWKGLSDLPAKTTFTGIEAHPNGVYQVGSDRFEAVGTVFLTLNFAKQKGFANSFPANIYGTMTPNGIQIDKIDVDTSSLDLFK